MRIVLVDVHCKRGSTGKIVYDLYSNLTQAGHDAAICYGRGPAVSGANIVKFASDIETYMHAFLTRATGFTGVFSPLSTRRLLEFMEAFNPDIVHIHELHAYFVNIAPVINYLKRKRIRTVWTFHCEFMYTGKCGYSYGCERWKSRCHHCPQLREYPKSLFFDFTARQFMEKKRLFDDFDNLRIVTPSKWLADRVKQSFLGRHSVKVIQNGIDTENVFLPRPYEHLRKKHGLGDGKIVLAVAPGLMQERKGGKWVIELASRFSDKNVKFILIGVDGSTGDHGSNVIALGRTSNQVELAEYYSMADAFVICSNMENFPTTCIEALSCGTPVVGFDSGGTRETAPPGYGLFAPYGNLDELESAVLSVLSGQAPIKCRKDIRRFAQEEYSRERMFHDYLDLYESSRSTCK